MGAAPKTETTTTREGKQTAKERKSIERFPALDDASLVDIATRARPALMPCICGCGTMTKSRFAPGHDAQLKERLKNTGTQAARDIENTLGW
jgi:hypothetical protein